MKSVSVKWGAVLIALNTLFSTVAYADTAARPTVFTDLQQIPPSKSSAILEAAEKRYLSGDPNGNFRPEAAITRQELAVILTKVLNLKSASGSPSLYKDVSGSHWSAYAVEAVKQAGIMTGDGSGHFNPAQPITKEELATIMVRAINGSGAHSLLADQAENDPAVSSWAKTSLNIAAQLELSEIFNTRSDPKAAVQRQDIAALLLNTFGQTEQSAVITSIDGDFVTIGGTPFLIEGKLKELIGDTNREALEGAVLKFNSLNRHVDSLQQLEIVKKGAQLHTGALPSGTLLSISADGVTIAGNVAGELKLNEGVSTIKLQGNISQFTVNSSAPVAVNGSGSLQHLKVNSGAKITIDPALTIQVLQLPDNVLPSQVIRNYAAIQSNIKQVQNASGAIVSPAAEISVASGNQQAVNHAPAVSSSIPALAKSVTDGTQTADLSTVFADEDGDALSFSAVSSDSGVATVSVSGNTLSVLPVHAGTTTITVTANDGKGGTKDTSFTATFTVPAPVNHTPSVVSSIPALAKSVTDGTQTADLSTVFADEDGDALSFSAVSSDSGVATVSVSGNTLSVLPVHPGTTTVTVTANDGNGGTKDTSFTATFTVPAPVNHTPSVISSIPALAKSVTDGTQTADLSTVFADEDGDALSFSAVSSDSGVATVSVSGNTLSVLPVHAGTTTVTVTANDGNGGTKDTSFTATFTVPAPVNHTPSVVSSIPALAKSVTDGTQTADLSTVFADEDGDALSFSAVSSDSGVATVSVSGNTLSVLPVHAGTTTVTVTANDGNGGTKDTSFTATFTVPAPVNHTPSVISSIPALTKSVTDGTQTADLSTVFADEDGDALSFSAVSSDSGVATVSVSGNTLSVLPVHAGTTTVTVTANDGNGGTKDTSFTATFTAAAGVFFSETIFGTEYLQAIELYNPTGEIIDGSKLRIERSDGGDPIVLTSAALSSKQAFVIMESFYEGEVPSNYFSTMLFFLDDTAPVTLSLYYDNELVDVAVISPYQSLARKSGTVIGSAAYQAGDWTDEGTDYTTDLGTYDTD